MSINFQGASPRRPAIFLQDACLQHRFIRSRDTSVIVERPERLRAVSLGLAAAIARLEDLPSEVGPSGSKKSEADTLAETLGRMNLVPSGAGTPRGSPVAIVHSQATVDILSHPGVKFVHGDANGDIYTAKLKGWAKDSSDKISKGDSEIPEGLSQGDLYLCPDSINAIQGALGTVCEAVDTVITSSPLPSNSNVDQPVRRAFAAIRPPGHHCGEDTPSGFCFVNNVAVGAAHAHLKHGINRVIILDIDLHHGNGTQSIAWNINEETYRRTLEIEAGAPAPEKPGLKIYYGSVHDILSYPCEDGKSDLVQAASVSLHQSHGQYIENVHLQTYTSEEHFWDVLYKEKYSKIIHKAEEFLDETGGPGPDALVFISCGMDACEHEYASMSRHNRKVPTSFYHRFTRDACALSDRYAGGRLVSVLEGGYSDRALISGAMAHLTGLVDTTGKVDEGWWSVDNLIKLEKATKKRRGGRLSLPAAGTVEPWIERTCAIFATLDTSATTSPSFRQAIPVPPSSMTLRERKKPSPTSVSGSQTETAPPDGKAKSSAPGKPTWEVTKPSLTESIGTRREGADRSSSPGSSLSSSGETELVAPKQLPRVILRLGPRPGAISKP